MDEKCPCEALKELQKITSQHERDLGEGRVNFAVINTKLNIVLGIMATIGVTVCGVVIKMLFNT